MTIEENFPNTRLIGNFPRVPHDHSYPADCTFALIDGGRGGQEEECSRTDALSADVRLTVHEARTLIEIRPNSDEFRPYTVAVKLNRRFLAAILAAMGGGE